MILKNIAIISLLGFLLLAGCAEPTPSPTPTSLPPTDTAIPTEISTLDSPIFACDPTLLVRDLRQILPYEGMLLSQNSFSDTYNLTAWYVDPDMDWEASGSAIEDQTALALRHSAEIAHTLVLLDPCILSTFADITVIIVDEFFNAWYLGAVFTENLTLEEDFNEADWVQLEEEFDEGYRRTSTPIDDDAIPAAEGACTWTEARTNLESLFAQARVNVSFHYYKQDESGEVWAQWDVPPVARTAEDINAGFFDSLPDVDAAVSCLHPPFETLWLVYVQQDGQAQWIFAVDGDAVRAEDHQEMLINLDLVYPSSE
jgi:hypothetical protein